MNMFQQIIGIFYQPFLARPNNQLVLVNSPNNQSRAFASTNDPVFDYNQTLDYITSYIGAFPKLFDNLEIYSEFALEYYQQVTGVLNNTFNSYLLDKMANIPFYFTFFRKDYESVVNSFLNLHTYKQEHPSEFKPNPIESIREIKVGDLKDSFLNYKFIDFEWLHDGATVQNVSIVVLIVITIGLLFTIMVRTYTKYLSVPTTINQEYLEQRAKQIKGFMYYWGVPITALLYYACSAVYQDLLNAEIKIILEYTLNQDPKPSSGPTIALSFMPFLMNSTPNWVIISVLLIIVIIFVNPYNIIFIVYHYLTYKNVFIFFLVCQGVLILYYVSQWIMLNLLLNKNVKISKDLPAFIRSKLIEYKNYSLEGKIQVIELFRRAIIVYVCSFTSILLFVLFVL